MSYNKVSMPIWHEKHLRAATTAAGVALWSWNVDTDAITMDERAYDLWEVSKNRHALDEKVRITWNAGRCGRFSRLRRTLREERDSHRRDQPSSLQFRPPFSASETPSVRVNMMNKRKPTYFRNSLDLRDKVQVKVLRRRLKLSDAEFATIVRKSGRSISAITKEATTT